MSESVHLFIIFIIFVRVQYTPVPLGVWFSVGLVVHLYGYIYPQIISFSFKSDCMNSYNSSCYFYFFL